MKNIVQYFILFCFAHQVTIHAQKKIVFESLRYNEDYSEILNDSTRNFYQKTKYFKIADKPTLYGSFGGEFRSQYQYYKNENWGDGVQDNDGFILNRILFHTDLHFSKKIRLFSQLQSSTSISRIDPNPVEENPIDLLQLFLDINFKNLTLRIGRQELSYGSQRLISVRENPNSRQSFDALKIIFKTENTQTDLLYGYYVKNQTGNFNDKIDDAIKLWGAYSTINHIQFIQNADVYYLGLEKEMAVFDDGSGKEVRHSVGSRIWGKINKFRYDLESVYQFGKVGDKTINAWTFSINSAYKNINLKFRPTFGIKTEYISGDRQYNDDKIQTFNPLFPKGAYFGQAALIGPSNLIDIHPSIELELTEQLNFVIDYDRFWRASKNDGIYHSNASLLYSGKSTTEKYIGNQLGFLLSYEINPFLFFKAEATWFDPKDYLKEVSSGKEILFLASTLSLKF
ncbi:alginate export family protein [Flavobacterium sp. XS2P12]|uniref:alginate export family protein n=1 Tax=Flavobacterium melibiosi TaxID=3398734 RepID=UPI003A894C40